MSGVFKIVVTGPFNSGKTTFISTISEIDVVSTERQTRGESGKADRTTVAMDFGKITLPDDNVIHLYGTPGQERFSFMWEILSEGMLGFVLLVDGSSPSTFPEAKRILDKFRSFSEEPFIVGVTRPDIPECAELGEVVSSLGKDGEVRAIKCDASKIFDVKRTLVELLEMVLEKIDEKEVEGAQRVSLDYSEKECVNLGKIV